MIDGDNLVGPCLSGSDIIHGASISTKGKRAGRAGINRSDIGQTQGTRNSRVPGESRNGPLNGKQAAASLRKSMGTASSQNISRQGHVSGGGDCHGTCAARVRLAPDIPVDSDQAVARIGEALTLVPGAAAIDGGNRDAIAIPPAKVQDAIVLLPEIGKADDSVQPERPDGMIDEDGAAVELHRDVLGREARQIIGADFKGTAVEIKITPLADRDIVAQSQLTTVGNADRAGFGADATQHGVVVIGEHQCRRP